MKKHVKEEIILKKYINILNNGVGEGAEEEEGGGVDAQKDLCCVSLSSYRVV